MSTTTKLRKYFVVCYKYLHVTPSVPKIAMVKLLSFIFMLIAFFHVKILFRNNERKYKDTNVYVSVMLIVFPREKEHVKCF